MGRAHAPWLLSQRGAAKSNQQAQIDMIEEILKWAGVTQATKVLLHHVSFICNHVWNLAHTI